MTIWNKNFDGREEGYRHRSKFLNNKIELEKSEKEDNDYIKAGQCHRLGIG
jgi:hypothetical protein